MLDHVLDALAAGGFARGEVVYISGYKQDVIRARYPDLTYVENKDWEKNNILRSLLCARAFLEDGFVSTYADIVYRPSIVADLVRSPADLALACDTDWQRRACAAAPETDAEKGRAEERHRLVRISKIPATRRPASSSAS